MTHNFLARYSIGVWLVIGFLIIYLIRLVISLNMGLMPQDAYYYLYSENLDWSYFDHPPMVAYFLKVSSFLFGQSELVIKLTDFFVSFLSFLGFYYLASQFLSKKRAVYAALLYGSTLQLTVISINTTPDVPLLFFWTLSLIVIYKAIEQNKIWLWAMSGVLIGLSFNSKYTGFFLLISLFIYLSISKQHRYLLVSKQMMALLLMSFVTVLPIIYWNVENQWASFAFQTTERAKEANVFSPSPIHFFGNIGTQFLLLIPVLFVSLNLILVKYFRKLIHRKKIGDQTVFLLAFSLPLMFFFIFISTFYWVKLNWMMPAYITLCILVSIYMKKKVVSYQTGMSIVLHVILLIQIVYYPVHIKSDDTWYGWKELAEKVKNLRKTDPDSFLFSADGYKTSSILNFYLNDHVYSGNVIGENGLQYSILNDNLDHLDGRNAYLIDSQNRFKNLDKSNKVPAGISDYFEDVIELDPIIINDPRSNPARKFLVYKCVGYNSGIKSN